MSANGNSQPICANDLLNLKQPYKGEKMENKSNIHVFFASNLGTYEVTKVHTMHPKALRNGVETILKICKNYKTIQQIDLAAFSQDKHNEDYFWNLVFWFKYQSLPYLWMAPFLNHLSPSEPGTSSSTRSTMQTEFQDIVAPEAIQSPEANQTPSTFENPMDMYLKFFMSKRQGKS